MTLLGLGFTNSVGKWDMCLCFGCGGMGSVGGKWDRVWESGVVLCLCVL